MQERLRQPFGKLKKDHNAVYLFPGCDLLHDDVQHAYDVGLVRERAVPPAGGLPAAPGADRPHVLRVLHRHPLLGEVRPHLPRVQPRQLQRLLLQGEVQALPGHHHRLPGRLLPAKVL